MRTNGWLRLWLVASLGWACCVGFYAYLAAATGPSGWEGDTIRTAALFWLLTSLGALAIGYGTAWAIRGFKSPSSPD